MPSTSHIAIIGGGAAGYFAAINAAENFPDHRVVILEGTRRPLTKVRVSGGGRCNVTHHCFDPRRLTTNYPRGQRELLGPFHLFQPQDTVAWFAQRGVTLKVESDGRMFPVTDSSETVIACLTEAAQRAGVVLRLGAIVSAVTWGDDGRFIVHSRDAGEELFDRVLLATGSAPQGHKMAAALGHTIDETVPSLFTFHISDPLLSDMAGLSFPDATLSLHMPEVAPFHQSGPLLVTHWGLSGPGILKLSAFAAVPLFKHQYQARLQVNFCGQVTLPIVLDELKELRRTQARRQLATVGLRRLPDRFWRRLVSLHSQEGLCWADASNHLLETIARALVQAELTVSGKGEFKEEFVTCGGVNLREVDFRTMMSKKVPGLYFAGEILNVDGITGGFNFQNAWTSAFIAAKHIGL